MSTVSITSILGSDSISGSRTTLNSNFLLLQNWINAYATTFNIDLVNGILDLSQASTGRISAKTGRFDEIRIPSNGATGAVILSTGAASFLGVNTTNLTSSGTSTFNGILNSTGIATFTSTTNLNGVTTNLGGRLTISGNFTTPSASSGNFVSNNILTIVGATASSLFNPATGDGGGFLTSSSIPYTLTGLEDVIYAQCSGSTGAGFFLSVGTSGGSQSLLPAGFRIRIINTQSSAGVINTGIQGGNYTGFNTDANFAGFPSAGITLDAGNQYKSSIHLQWEPRISLGVGTEQGSWVVLSSSNMNL